MTSTTTSASDNETMEDILLSGDWEIITAAYDGFVMDKMHEDNRANKDYAFLGLAGEAGEVVDTWKKTYHGREMDEEKLVDELGDLFFYFTLILIQNELFLDDIILRNVEKLNARYPNGSADNGRADG